MTRATVILIAAVAIPLWFAALTFVNNIAAGIVAQSYGVASHQGGSYE